MKRKAIILTTLFLIIIAGGITWNYLFAGHDDLIDVNAEFTVSAVQLLTDFRANENVANKKYTNKIVEVNGTVAEIIPNGKTFTLFLYADSVTRVSCTLADNQTAKINQVKTGSKVEMRGQCAGLLSDVVLVRCVFVRIRN